MVSTRGKKKTASPANTIEDNGAAENALAEKLTSDSVAMNVEEANMDAQVEDKTEISVEGARNEKSDDEEGENLTKVENNGKNTIATEMNGDDKAESEENTSEDEEIDDQEYVLWEHDVDNSEEDNEENVGDEYDLSEEEETGEQEDDEDEVSEEETADEQDEDEDKVSEEEATEEGDEGNTQKEKEIPKEDGKVTGAKDDRNEAEKNNTKQVEVSLKNAKKSSEKSKKKKVQVESKEVDRPKKVESKDKPESSRKRKGKKRVASMGMVFMCSSKTKSDCYKYRVLGLPESKKDTVEKIYTGMRLFLYDIDLKLMYGIYKAAGPGGYNIEPKAFNSQYPSQVRFAVLDDCSPLAEEKFKKVIKENYFTNTKFDCQLNAEQVKQLCKMFIATSKRRSPKKLRMRHKGVVEPHLPVRRERSTRRRRDGDGRRIVSREELHHRELPRKRPRKAIISPPRQRPPPRPVSPVPTYAYERTSHKGASFKLNPYSETRSPYRDRRDPPLARQDPYRDGRDPPPVERYDYYRDGRVDPYPERHYAYRDDRDPYTERRDPYKDGRDPYTERRDPYRDGRDPYTERRDLYRDGRDPYIERRDPYRDERDPYAERRDPLRDGRDPYVEIPPSYLEPYRVGATTEASYSTYSRDPLAVDRHDAYREVRGVDLYRREEVLERHDRLGIGGRDSYVSVRDRALYNESIASAAEYPSRARVYRL